MEVSSLLGKVIISSGCSFWFWIPPKEVLTVETFKNRSNVNETRF